MPHIPLPENVPGLEMHDPLLIAANFCRMNRDVDSLAARTPKDPDFFRQRAASLALHGYASSAGRS